MQVLDIFRVIVAGTRTFQDYSLLQSKLDHLLQNKGKVEIVSGGASGADLLGEKYSKEKGHFLIRFPADWNKYGKKAGPLRNRKMAEYANALVVFWNGESSGSKNMIEEAKQRNLLIRVVKYK